jgi:hypothetical protein
VVAVQGAETAGLDPYLGGPAADVLAACDATGKAGEVTPAVMWVAGAARFSPDGDEAKGATGFGTRLLLRWLCELGAETPPVTA